MSQTATTGGLSVVGLGASAGGLQALQAVLAGLPPALDAAVVVVQHLSPDFETRMDELLAAHTKLPIHRVVNEMVLEPGAIYLMPPEVEMSISGGRALLSERMPDHGLWLPIDSFFRSMAEDIGPRAIGVILSGTGSDGSRGMRAIHEAGGLALVQEPETARFDGMPRSAIDTGVVDLVLPPGKIGETIARYAERARRDDLARERIEALELELRYAKENLQATIEELEASNEELQATNEELIASNEELHSANEELQSVNEELHTVNAEHQQKIAELQQMANDMEHLFQATDVQEAVEQRDRFLAMLSHELRNPLAAIGNAAHMIEEAGEPSLRPVASALARQTQHIKDLLDDLLDVNRLTLDRLTIKMRKAYLGEIVERSLEAVEDRARQRGVRIELPSEVPEHVLAADPSRLQQMLTNVLVNAVKFSDVGGTVRLQVRNEEGRVLLRVEDDGVGIDPAAMERIFELFYQEQQDLDRSGGGLGVGLSLARKIAGAHGGSIRACSNGRGRGAAFEMALPLPTQGELDALEEPDARSPKQGEVPALDVVVVEDQQDNRDMLSMFVSMRGHRAIGVADGEEAIATILRTRPDLALVDIGLPGMDGYEVARRLRALDDGRALYLVALTGYGRSEDRARARSAGFDDHVVKPMSRRELSRLLATAAQRRTPRIDEEQST